MNEQNFWAAFFATIAHCVALTIDMLSDEVLGDATNYQAWLSSMDAYGLRVKAVAVHTSEHPYCLMSDCPCHDDAQDTPVTDQSLRISAQFQGMMDSLLLEHD
ncbi:MAG: hypothetical protein ABI396_04155 [Ktedonobacteraceae bacterium]